MLARHLTVTDRDVVLVLRASPSRPTPTASNLGDKIVCLYTQGGPKRETTCLTACSRLGCMMFSTFQECFVTTLFSSIMQNKYFNMLCVLAVLLQEAFEITSPLATKQRHYDVTQTKKMTGKK